MSNSEERSRFEKERMKTAFEELWRSLSRAGDPERIPNKVQRGFYAGWNARAALEDRQETPKWQHLPDEQAWWWHWNGEDLSIPHIYCVMVSKTGRDRYFIAHPDSRWCDEMGGAWLKLERPNVPERGVFKPAVDRQEAAPEVGPRIDNLINYAANLQSDTIYLDPDDIAFIHEYYGCKTGCCTKFAGKIMKPKGGVPSEATPSKEDSGPIWRKCDQCGRENSLETWAKYLGKCPSCHNLHDRDSPHPENRECNTCGGTIAPGPDGKWWHLKAGDALKCRTGLVSPKPSAPAPEVQGTPTKEEQEILDHIQRRSDEVAIGTGHPPGTDTIMLTEEESRVSRKWACPVNPAYSVSHDYRYFPPVGTPQKETPPHITTGNVLDDLGLPPEKVSALKERYENRAVPEGVQGKEPQTPTAQELAKGYCTDMIATLQANIREGKETLNKCPRCSLNQRTFCLACVNQLIATARASGEAAGRSSAITEIQERAYEEARAGNQIHAKDIADWCAELQEKTK